MILDATGRRIKPPNTFVTPQWLLEKARDRLLATCPPPPPVILGPDGKPVYRETSSGVGDIIRIVKPTRYAKD